MSGARRPVRTGALGLAALVALGLVALVGAVGGCAKVAPNRTFGDEAISPRPYPFEAPGLYQTVYPASAPERAAMQARALAAERARTGLPALSLWPPAPAAAPVRRTPAAPAPAAPTPASVAPAEESGSVPTPAPTPASAPALVDDRPGYPPGYRPLSP